MKSQILIWIEENTKKGEIEKNTLAKISEKFKLSRNETAFLLKSLVSEKQLLKISTRPVCYAMRSVIEETRGEKLDKQEYATKEELFQADCANSFSTLIGVEGSLSELVKQCKATLAYPPNGLPLLLFGPTGTGKSLIARLAYEYAKEQGILQKDAVFISINCSEYANNPELLTSNLFGHIKGAFTGAEKDNPGLLSLADGGVLFLDEVHNLKYECQEKLFQFMDQATYHRVGDNKTWYHAKVRLMFATTEPPQKVLLKTLLRRIPMIITVPSLKERGVQEKIQFLYTMFHCEEKRLGCNIFISPQVYHLLLLHDFSGNVGGLKSCIQSCCINAFFSRKEDGSMHIHTYDLPEQLQVQMTDSFPLFIGDSKEIAVSHLHNYIEEDKEIIHLHKELLHLFEEYQKENECEESEFFRRGNLILKDYFDQALLHQEKGKYELYRQQLQKILQIQSIRYGYYLNNNDLLCLGRYLQDYHAYEQGIQNWTYKERERLKEFLVFLAQTYEREYQMIQEFQKYLNSCISIYISECINMILFFLIKRNRKQSKKRIGVILAHGFSTASSIADAVNQLLEEFVFDAIDMPLDAEPDYVIQHLRSYISRIERFEEVFLLVDMGSLEKIYKGLDMSNANIGIINNVNSKIALEIGNGMLGEKSMEDILTNASKGSRACYHIERNRQKKKLILCSCASGIGTAEKLQLILKRSLPKEIDIAVQTYHYTELLEKGIPEVMRDEYHILFVIGTLNPMIKNLRFLPLETLIVQEESKELEEYLEGCMEYEQLQEFKKNIIKNFTLSNIMSNLTILNPNKLLELVAEAIDQLQLLLKRHFPIVICFGLYVHICCLIERLIKQRTAPVYPDIDVFVDQQADFIAKLQLAFQKVETFYGVKIPIEEIGYIFDYIEHMKK